MQQINLLEPKLLPTPELVSGARILVVAVLGLLGVSLHLGIEQDRMARTMAAAQAAPPSEIGESLEALGQDGDPALRVRLLQRQALRDVLAKHQALPPDSASLMSQVMAVLPETLWLTEVDLVGLQGIRISGGALEPEALRQFAERLATIPTLKGAPVETLRLELDEDNPGSAADRPAAHQFVLVSATYNTTGSGR